MEIVIKMSEVMYGNIKQYGIPFLSCDDKKVLRKSIANGTPIEEESKAECTYKETGCGSCKRQLDCPMEAEGEGERMIVDKVHTDTMEVWKAEILRKEHTNEVLDKIKAEIEQNAYPIVHGVNNHEKGMTLYGILQVIDKYKAESEG